MSSQYSLVVSWKRIYNSLTVTIAHIKSFFCRLMPLYSFSSHSHSSTTSKLPASELNSLISTLHRLHGKQPVLLTALLPSNRSPIVPCICFCGNVFSDLLPSNVHGTDHIENNFCSTFLLLHARISGVS